MKRRGATDDENEEETPKKSSSIDGKKKEKGGLNYYAIFIMLLFALPMAITGALYVRLLRLRCQTLESIMTLNFCYFNCKFR